MTLLTLLNSGPPPQTISPTGIATTEAFGKPGTLLRTIPSLSEWVAMWEDVPLPGGWLGGDGCWSFTHPSGTSAVFTFGDTPITSGGNHFPNSSAVLWTNTGLKLVSGTGPWIPNDGDGTWYWAGSMCMEGNTLFVFPSKQQAAGGGGFTVIGRGLFSFTWSDPDAAPTSPTKIVDLDPAIGWGAAVVTISGYHYIFGTHKESNWFGHDIYLARCPVGSLSSGTSAWEFWTTTSGGSWQTGSGHLTSVTGLQKVIDANEPGFTLGTSGLENSFSADLVNGEIKLCSKRAGVYGSDVCIWEASAVTGPYRRRVVAQAPYGVPTANDQTYLENAHYDLPPLANGKVLVSVSRNQAGRATLDFFTNPDQRYWPWWFEVTADQQWVDPTGIPSAEAVGSPTVTSTITVSPSGIASAEAVGSPTVTAGAVTISPTSVNSAEAVGQPTLVPGPVTVAPTGIATAEAVGSPTLTPGPVTISPTSVASAEVVSSPVITSGTVVSPTGIPSGEAVGSPTLTPGPVTISPASVASAEAVGDVAVTSTATVSLTGIPSGEEIGSPTTTRQLEVVEPTGIPSQETVGAPALTVHVLPGGIPSEEAFGALSVAPGAVVISPSGIASAETFGTPLIGGAIIPGGIVSAEAFGTFSVSMVIRPTGIPSAGALGTPLVSVGPPPGGRDVDMTITLGPQRIVGSVDLERIVAGLADQTRVVATLAAQE